MIACSTHDISENPRKEERRLADRFNVRNEGGRQVVLRTERIQFVYVGCIGLVIIIVSWFQLSGKPAQWITFLLLLMAWFSIFWWLSRFRIVLASHVLTYSQPGKRAVSVDRGEISSVALHFGRFEHAIVINCFTGRPVKINTKPFSRADLRLVVNFLSEKIRHNDLPLNFQKID